MYLVTTPIKTLRMKTKSGQQKDVSVCWVPGQLGVLPAFVTRAAAEQYAGHPSKVIEINAETQEVIE